MHHARLPWPLFTLDFEASGLGEFTYPIEIGVASWTAPDAPIETWSALIRPPEAWRQHRIWSVASEDVHHIRREQLEEGLSPAEALACANDVIGQHLAFCDGGEHDLRWLLQLAQAARATPSFRLADWDGLTGVLGRAQYARMIRWLEQDRVVHRAGADAERLMKAIAVGVGA